MSRRGLDSGARFCYNGGMETPPTKTVTICGIESEVNLHWANWVECLARSYAPGVSRDERAKIEAEADELLKKYRQSIGLNP